MKRWASALERIPSLGLRTVAALVVLAILAAIGVGLGIGRLARPSPTPVRVSVTFAPVVTPAPTPLDEATLFRQPLSGGCATSEAVWIVTNGGGLMRWDGTKWSQPDGTLRSLMRVSCSRDDAYAVGLLGAVMVSDEPLRQIRAADITTEDLFGVSAFPDGALIVGTRGTVFLLFQGDLQPYAAGIDEDLLAVVQFSLQSAWAVGDRGITYRLDQRGWNPIGSGQTKTLRAVAGTTPSNSVAVGDGGVIVRYDSGWKSVKSDVEVTLRDVIVDPALWIVGDKGTVLTGSLTSLRKVDLGTSCDLLSVFTRGNEVWVVGRAPIGGGVWQLRADGTVAQKWGGC
ncbi:MAG TPA: hypothetical protein VJQ09_00175 [Candidatus Limnocylindria bacterium]|nr:hypothetical protein [Candidatus Limnocylindria bacterium]